MRISDWSSDVCSSDLSIVAPVGKSGPGTIAINSSSVIAGLSIVASVASITSPRLCGGILVDATHNLGEVIDRSEEHTSELQSLMRISYAVFCLKKKNKEGKTRLQLLRNTQQTIPPDLLSYHYVI